MTTNGHLGIVGVGAIAEPIDSKAGEAVSPPAGGASWASVEFVSLRLTQSTLGAGACCP
jgi:hypothetical protein